MSRRCLPWVWWPRPCWRSCSRQRRSGNSGETASPSCRATTRRTSSRSARSIGQALRTARAGQGGLGGTRTLTPEQGIVLGVAGFLGGAINSVAGGGSLVSFPALLAVGYPSVTANVTNTVALWPGYLGGAVAYRRELTGQRSRAMLLGATCVVGATLG